MRGSAVRALGGVGAVAAALMLSACWPWSSNPPPKPTTTAPDQIGQPGSAFPGPGTRVTNGQALVEVYKVGPDMWAYVVAQAMPNPANLVTSITILDPDFPSKCPVAAAEWATPAASPVPWTATPGTGSKNITLSAPKTGSGSTGAASVGVTIGKCDFKNATALYFQVALAGGKTIQVGPVAGPSDK